MDIPPRNNGSDQPPLRHRARLDQREPRVPPAHLLQQVDGRVLDPSTALVVKGVRPRSTAYVGPRLTLSDLLFVG